MIRDVVQAVRDSIQGQAPYLLVDLSGKLVPKEYWTYRSVCRAIGIKTLKYRNRDFVIIDDKGVCLCETEWSTEKVYPNRVVFILNIIFKHETQE